jgi:hypothetical protein
MGVGQKELAAWDRYLRYQRVICHNKRSSDQPPSSGMDA